MVPITKATHANQVWRRLSSYAFAANESYVPVSGIELAKAAAAMPLAFVESSGQLVPVAMLSLQLGVNLFVAPDGRWLGSYIPLLFRTYPFRLLRQPNSDRYSLWVDEDASDRSDPAISIELFYGPEGNLAPATKAVFDILSQFEQNRLSTMAAVALLAEAGVICPWPIKLADGDKEQTLGGFHRIDEMALNNLGDEAFLRLRKAGALPIAYAQLLSLAQLGVFSQLADLRRRISQATGTMPSPGASRQPQATQGTFSMADSEALRFD